MRAHSLTSGFSLLEVLVALLLLALGIVGSAAMQIVALRVSQQDQLLGQAQHLASTLAERMHANAALARDMSATNPYLFDYDAAGAEPPAAPPVQCFAAACDGLQLAQFDRYEAQWQVFHRFPAGRVLICRDEHPVVAGRLHWDCAGGTAAPLVIKLGWRGKLADGSAAGAVPSDAGAASASAAVAPALALTVRVP